MFRISVITNRVVPTAKMVLYAMLPVADALMAKGAPFLFVTGMGESGLPESYRKLPLLRKPFTKADLARQFDALAQVCASQGPA